MQCECQNCGTTFESLKTRKFCGHLCANQHRARNATQWVTFNCERCGTQVVTKPRYLGKYHFCKLCRPVVIGKRANTTQTANGKRKEPITIICWQCQQPFTVLACYSYRRYCGRACFAASQRGGYTPPQGEKNKATGIDVHEQISQTPRLQRPSVKSTSLGIGGFRKDLGFYVRSRWEANYARYLKYIKMPFAYEPHQFLVTLTDGSNHCITPDFLVNDDHYIEIKGWMREDRRQPEIIAAAQKQLPKPLYIFGKSQYRAFERQYVDKVPHWERAGDPPPGEGPRLCGRCGKPIISSHRLTRFCSKSCGARTRSLERIEKTCRGCGQTFTVAKWEENRQYCSRDCRFHTRQIRFLPPAA